MAYCYFIYSHKNGDYIKDYSEKMCKYYLIVYKLNNKTYLTQLLNDVLFYIKIYKFDDITMQKIYYSLFITLLSNDIKLLNYYAEYLESKNLISESIKCYEVLSNKGIIKAMEKLGYLYSTNEKIIDIDKSKYYYSMAAEKI